MRKLIIFLLLALLVGLAACGGGGGDGNTAAGEKLFNEKLIGVQPGCVTCHSLEPGVVIVGPSLATIGADAGSRVDGKSAEQYIRQSIMETDAFVVEGFIAGTMPAALSDEMSEAQINNLVAYLMTLK